MTEIKITPTTVVAVLALAALLFLAVKYVQTPGSAPQAAATTLAPALPQSGPEYAEVGDAVSFDYIGRFAKNKTVFDTSLEDAAKKAGIYNAARTYAPSKVFVGRGELIPGFEEALIGMKKGEQKTVTIPPEKAYGQVNKSLIIETNRTRAISKTITLTIDDFNYVYNTDPVVGESYSIADSAWPLKVLNTSGGVVYAEQEAKVGDSFNGVFGTAEIVGVTDDSIFVRENPVKGVRANLMYGTAKVVDYNEDSILLDLNHPLAGETLEFTIILRDLMKG